MFSFFKKNSQKILYEDAKTTKGEINLLSLLSTFDDIIDSQPEAEEKEKGHGSGNAPKLPRTNSLEDLGIKVLNK